MPINTPLIRLWCRDGGGVVTGRDRDLFGTRRRRIWCCADRQPGPTLGKTCCASRRQAPFPSRSCWVRTHAKRTAQRPARAPEVGRRMVSSGAAGGVRDSVGRRFPGDASDRKLPPTGLKQSGSPDVPFFINPGAQSIPVSYTLAAYPARACCSYLVVFQAALMAPQPPRWHPTAPPSSPMVAPIVP